MQHGANGACKGARWPQRRLSGATLRGPRSAASSSRGLRHEQSFDLLPRSTQRCVTQRFVACLHLNWRPGSGPGQHKKPKWDVGMGLHLGKAQLFIGGAVDFSPGRHSGCGNRFGHSQGVRVDMIRGVLKVRNCPSSRYSKSRL